MIISSSQVQSILMLQSNAYKNNYKVDTVSSDKTDSLELSNRAQEMKATREMVLKCPDVRADKVNELKNQIQAGTYQVSSGEIASKMVDRSLVDELAEEVNLAMSNELHLLIEQEIEALDQLNSLSLSKKEALLKNDLDALSEITLTEERLAEYLKKIDDACSPQVQFFLKKENTNDSNIPETLRALITKLRQSALQLKTNNQFNQELLKDSIGLVKFTVNLLTHSTKYSTNTYNPEGKAVDETVKSCLLDFKG